MGAFNGEDFTYHPVQNLEPFANSTFMARLRPSNWIIYKERDNRRPESLNSKESN